MTVKMILNLYYVQYALSYKDDPEMYFYEEAIKAIKSDDAFERLIKKVYEEEANVTDIDVFFINCVEYDIEE